MIMKVWNKITLYWKAKIVVDGVCIEIGLAGDEEVLEKGARINFADPLPPTSFPKQCD